jgi:hypothetical protein
MYSRYAELLDETFTARDSGYNSEIYHLGGRVAKKNSSEGESSVVDKEILRTAKAASELEQQRAVTKCGICGSDAAPTSTESLCWVCRRLKISAWRESDQQISLQE